jgi:DNA-binding response OmpR family regulator
MATPKVLLIEDDRTMVSLLRTLLRYEGFEVTLLEQEETLDEIISTIRREQPALILLDVHLRQLNGFDLLHDLRADQTLRGIRVLMSSGIDFSTRCLHEGADGFILKPYMPEELTLKIRQTLGEKNQTVTE